MSAVFSMADTGARYRFGTRLPLPPTAVAPQRRADAPGLLLHCGREADAGGRNGFILDVRDALGLAPDAGAASDPGEFQLTEWQDAMGRPVTSAWAALDKLRCLTGDRRRPGGSSVPKDAADHGTSSPVCHLVDASRGARRWRMGRSSSASQHSEDDRRYRFHIGDGVDSLEMDEGVEAVTFGYGIFMDAPEMGLHAVSGPGDLWIDIGLPSASDDGLGAQAGLKVLRFADGASCPCAAPRTMVIRETGPSQRP